MNLKTICRFIGSLVLLEGILLLLCLAVGIIYRETDLLPIIIPSALAIVLGVGLRIHGRNARANLFRREAYFIVAIVWIVFSAIGMLPFLLSPHDISVSTAFFEAMSGFTTTGASALSQLDALPHSLLFWRSLSQWIGGLGIVFFTLTLLPSNIQGGGRLFSAEATGLTHEKLHPRIGTTARWLWSLYAMLTATCALCLWLGGMSTFDSVNFAMTTLATGGFAPHASGILFYNSATIELIEMLFMFIGGINFTILYLLFVKHKFRNVLRNEEIRYFCLSTLIIGFICSYALFIHGHDPLDALRRGFFNVISLHTTTGFVSDNYALWYHPTLFLLLIATATGACAGSTTGGIKSVRVLVLLKTATSQFKRLLHPNAIIPVRLNHAPVYERTEHVLISYFFWYVVLILAGAIAFDIMNLPLLDAVSLSISCVNNIGPIVGHEFTPLSDFSALSPAAKWVSCFLMLAGRLEIFSILLPLTSSFWKQD
ncbi:MAG: TrkH family potassium uptake protein [Bacteroidaceae bacterium]|nr:TrkH family potassium uptake protein [Bacteroidaceae bacterium]